jgi:hypothetical protein
MLGWRPTKWKKNLSGFNGLAARPCRPLIHDREISLPLEIVDSRHDHLQNIAHRQTTFDCRPTSRRRTDRRNKNRRSTMRRDEPGEENVGNSISKP